MAHRTPLQARNQKWRRGSFPYSKRLTPFFSLAVMTAFLCHPPMSGKAQYVSFTQRLPDSDRRPSSPCLRSTLPGYTYFIDLDGKGCVVFVPTTRLLRLAVLNPSLVAHCPPHSPSFAAFPFPSHAHSSCVSESFLRLGPEFPFFLLLMCPPPPPLDFAAHQPLS